MHSECHATTQSTKVTTCLAPAQLESSSDGSVNSVSLATSINHYQVSSCINYPMNTGTTSIKCKVSKSRLFKSLFKKNGFLAVSGSDLGWGLQLTTRLNKLLVSDLEAEQLLCLFQYIILFSLYRSSSSYWLYMLKSMKVLSYLCVDKIRFLVIYHRKWPTLCILCLWNLKGRP